ncbi:hypothetical protein [Nostoc sp. GT001]|uniref:hypothetical protein n=1 Tax=Nostoc sp. GT001 TaxID=3056647 RepID=UPI0025AA3665|nr:hypothetical protein [Nostoc sp. GT001]MDM9583099.1 hypothetical protein [Nostoc sp. GT001]
MLKQPLLFFAMQLDETPQLNRGRLFLCDYEKGIVGRWIATSGLGQYQGTGDWSKQGGGVIPPTYEMKTPIDFYKVATKPVDLKHVKGVEGNGYPITPFTVETKLGVKRSDLLIHKDANQPGSLGCIVLSTPEFADFERVFSAECSDFDSVKLLVGYTY